MGRGRPVREDGNHRKCMGEWENGPCSSLVYWREGDYCPTHREVPERRCLDCGQTSRAGILEYNLGYRLPMPVPAWDAIPVEDSWFPDQRDPKAIKDRTDQRQYLVVAPGTCRYCDSANLAPLEFGMDRLPDGQATCTAWPTLDKFNTWHGSYTSWLNKAADDPGITLKACASCGKPLVSLKGHGDLFGKRLGDYGTGIRHPRVTYPDGRWSQDSSVWVHDGCPDPEAVPVAA